MLIVLDAQDRELFESAVANARFLASRAEALELIVVGVENSADRARDLTPRATGATARRMPTAGGADQFARFLSTELLPHIRARYRTRALTLLAGHSLGGLFAIHVVASGEPTYGAVIAMSPSIWWNDSTALVSYSDAISRLPTPPRLFVTSGSLEGGLDRATRRFAERLDSLRPSDGRFRYQRLEGDAHGMTPLPSVIAGLRFAFAPLAVTNLPIYRLPAGADSAAIVRAVLASEAEYGRGAAQLGLAPHLPHAIVNEIGYFALYTWRMPGLATWIFARNVAAYPYVAESYDSYADALGVAGDTAAALENYAIAARVARAYSDSLAAVSRAKAERLRSARRR